ncbi:phytanoyl-CoA dioxygenase family protein [Myxococcota bacterium]|nr:phytanoyl-CoA dioxygenase family protein [Myxococcota bacterium]
MEPVLHTRKVFQLSEAELDHFEREGWVGPFPLLGTEDARALEPELARHFQASRGYFYPADVREGDCYYEDSLWFQSLHTMSAALASIGRRPELLDRIEQLLGKDLIQWAGIRFEQNPHERLLWHTDTEYDHWGGVSTWMGIQNVTPETALKILPGSHRFPASPEDIQHKYGLDLTRMLDDDEMLSELQRILPDLDNEPRVLRVPVHDGEFVIFDGKLWHASHNPSDCERVAMGMRYSSPDQRIRIPLTYLPPLIFDPTRPPCLLVRGEDRFGVNRIVEAPQG